MQVEGREYQLLNSALVDSFSLAELKQMSEFGLKEDLEDLVSITNKTNTVFELIGYYNRRDQVEMLLQAARHYNPSNGQLFMVAQLLSWATQVSARIGADSLTPVEAERGLEGLVRENVLKMPAKETREQMMRVEGHMCVVELKQRGGKGKAQGSGFLVGPKAVLTNYHVVRNYLGDNKVQRLQVRFDAEPQTGTVREADEGVVFAVKEIPISSPYTKGDPGNRKGPPKKDELDFAVLLLDEDAGNSMIGGGGAQKDPVKRDYIEMPFDNPKFEVGGPLIIYQYPGGRELMMSIDTEAVVETAWDGMRVRYRNNTERGSSGSPVFNMEWNLVALHHATGPDTEGEAELVEFNQGIPIALIRDYVEAQELGYVFGE
jgi:hypothetical protein